MRVVVLLRKLSPTHLEEIDMRTLRAVKEVFLLGGFGFLGRGVGVWVRHFGCSTVLAGRVYVPCVDQGGQRRGEEDVSFG